jgi:hypothetical protein
MRRLHIKGSFAGRSGVRSGLRCMVCPSMARLCVFRWVRADTTPYRTLLNAKLLSSGAFANIQQRLDRWPVFAAFVLTQLNISILFSSVKTQQELLKFTPRELHLLALLMLSSSFTTVSFGFSVFPYRAVHAFCSFWTFSSNAAS